MISWWIWLPHIWVFFDWSSKGNPKKNQPLNSAKRLFFLQPPLMGFGNSWPDQQIPRLRARERQISTVRVSFTCLTRLASDHFMYGKSSSWIGKSLITNHHKSSRIGRFSLAMLKNQRVDVLYPSSYLNIRFIQRRNCAYVFLVIFIGTGRDKCMYSHMSASTYVYLHLSAFIYAKLHLSTSFHIYTYTYTMYIVHSQIYIHRYTRCV